MGDVLGRYEILSELGRGGMGAVYLARHTLLEKTVALKTLLPHLAEHPGHVARFMREARAAANLNHPNIVQVFDVDQAGGRHFFAMELIEGETLHDRIRARRPLPPAESVEIARQIADALAFAHARGIVHRDLKPANIMLDARGQVKVMDFGIAAAANVETLTLTGQLLGTPKYMSPEQARSEDVDGRSDLFSLGMTMCEMLAGRTPLDGMDLISAVGTLLRVDEPFVLGLPSTVPPSLRAVVERATQKDRAARYPNAAALIADLDRVAVELGLPARAGRAGEPGPGRTDTMALPAQPAAAQPGAMQPAGTQPTPATPPSTTRPPRGARSEAQLSAVGRRSWLRPILVLLLLTAVGGGIARWRFGGERAPKQHSADSAQGGGPAGAVTQPVLDARTDTIPTPPAPEPAPTLVHERAASAEPKALPPPPASQTAKEALRVGASAPPAPPSGQEIAVPEPMPSPPPSPPPPDPRASVAAAIEPHRQRVAAARAAADQDSAQGTTSYGRARAFEDSLLPLQAAADTTGAFRVADQANTFYGRAREERQAVLARRAAIAERERALAEPSHQRSAVTRGDGERRDAEAAFARGDFAAARAAFEAATDEYERAARKSR